MALNYMVYQYDGSRNAVVMTDMDGKELVIDCDRAEAHVIFDEPNENIIINENEIRNGAANGKSGSFDEYGSAKNFSISVVT